MDYSSNRIPLPQLFQEHSSLDSLPLGPVIGINTHLDTKSNQHVILWSDIEYVFSNARYVVRDRTVISLLADDELIERKPKMILYHPGVILKVIVTMHRGYSPTIDSEFSLAGSAVIPSVDTAQEQISQLTTEAELETSSVAAAKRNTIFARARTYSFSSLLHKRHSSTKEPRPPLHEADSDKKEHERLVNIKSDLQWQLEESRQQVQEIEARMTKKIRSLKEKITAMLEQNERLMDHMAAKENQIQTLITQNYELHEYPVPRLFIILPKDERKRDFARNLVSKTFRLYFLCECGVHTGREADRSPHSIHLANHDGYDIVKQSDFVRKYGSHLLKVLQMVKFSLIAAEAAVPALQHFKVVHNLENIMSTLGLPNETLSALLDESISFVGSRSGNRNHSASAHMDSVDLGNLPSLEGAQLRQLESFLSLNDQSRELGNLYRIATKSGHIKWVCKDHYDIFSQSSAPVIKELHVFAADNGGDFIEEEGMVTVKLDSEARAGKFYGVMAKAKCFHELRVTLDWTVTRDHLQNLYDALINSNIVRLELGGCGKANTISKIDDSLFRPLLDLMSSGKIQIMVLERVYHRDLLYVNTSGMRGSKRLRELTFKDLSTLDNGRISTLPSILKFLPSLTTLSVKSEFAHDILSWIQRNPLRFSSLKTLMVHEIGQLHYHLVVRLSRGKIKSIEVMRLSSRSWNADGILDLLSCGHVTKLGVLLDGASVHEDRCMEILRCNPNVEAFHLFIPELSSSAVDWAISSMHENHLKQQSTSPQQIKIYCDTHPEIPSCTLDFNKDPQAFNISTDIQLIPHRCNIDNLVSLASKYGRSLTCLDFRDHFSSELASALDSSMKLGFSNLTQLLLNPARLVSPEDSACLDRIIRQSKHLTTFSAVLRMDDINWKAGANWLFGAHKGLLTGLTLEGVKGIMWNKGLAKLFPPRSDLTNLEALSLKRVDTTQEAEAFSKWVADMTSMPSPPPRRISFKMFTRTKSKMIGSDSSYQAHLKQIELDSIIFNKSQWETIFKSMDCAALEKLALMDNKLTSKQLELLMARIVSFGGHDTVLPLQELNIGGHIDGGLWRLSERVKSSLRKKAPRIEVKRVHKKQM
ncbi:hypothetical protein BGZ99_002641 [Dissophora globulifera]|uniref:Uncharacterized protein n=1 Tax=Dissophora globulifera TaxID=979702 RepID=A0A9P6RS49_9FUNG|nr:hypothetical protein BGZ99_002641 [Dissophora globulifera]